MRVTTVFGFIVALVAVAAGCAREPATLSSPADARIAIDRIVRSSHRLDLDGLASPDLTSEVNALLAMDEREVLDAVAEGLDRFRYQGIHLQDLYRLPLETLAALLVGEEFVPDEWQVGMALRVQHGFVLASGVGGGFYSGPDPWVPPGPLDSYTKGATTLRAPFEPDGAALLRHLLGPAAMPQPFRDDQDLRVSAGLALGSAARSDPDLAERLLREAKRVGNRDDRLEVVAFALGRLATDEAAKAMEDLFVAAAAPRGRDAPFELLVKATRAGLPEEFLGRIWLRIPAIAPEAGEHFEWSAAGEIVARAKLVAAVAERNDANLTQLGNAALGQAISSLSVETFRGILNLGLEAESPEVLTRLLWPLDRSDTQSPGYPDPVEQARRFREDLRAGRITLRPGELDSPGIYAELVSAGPPDEHSVGQPPDSGIRLEASIEGDEIRIDVENGGKAPCFLNPEGFEYGSLVWRSTAWKTGDPWEADEQVPHLWLGRVATGMVPTVRASDLILLSPGRTRRFTWPLGKGIPADKRVYVWLQDEISVEGHLAAPLLRYAAPVRAR